MLTTFLYMFTNLIYAICILIFTLQSNKRGNKIKKYLLDNGATEKSKAIKINNLLEEAALVGYIKNWGPLRTNDKGEIWYDLEEEKRFRMLSIIITILLTLFVFTVFAILIISMLLMGNLDLLFH